MGKFSVLQTQVFQTIGPDLLFEKPGSGGHPPKIAGSVTVDAGDWVHPPPQMPLYSDLGAQGCRDSTEAASGFGLAHNHAHQAEVVQPNKQPRQDDLSQVSLPRSKLARLHEASRPKPNCSGKRTAKQVQNQSDRCMATYLAKHPRLAAKLHKSSATTAATLSSASS